MIVAKEFTFDAAHSIPHHSGKCRFPHGHTYRVRVYVEGKVAPVDGRSDGGMVVDFGVLSEIWHERVEPRLDHRNLNLSLPVKATTAELIAAWILREFRRGFQSRDLPADTVLKVRVYETPTAYAEAGSADLDDLLGAGVLGE